MFLFGFFIPNWIVLLVFVILLLYKWSLTGLDYFIKLNVPHDKPIPFFGIMKDFYLQRDNLSNILMKQYEKYKEKRYFGIFEHRTPILVINDPAIIRRITVTDFDHFVNQDDVFFSNFVLRSSINMLKDRQWHDMRSLLSPVFASQNLRFMFYLLEECCYVAMDNLKRKEIKCGSSMEIDIKDFLTRFTFDVVASTALGIKPDAQSSESSVLYNKMQKAGRVTSMTFLLYFLFGNARKIMEFFNMSILDSSCISYFYSLVQDIIKFRLANNIRHFDIIQLLMDKRLEYEHFTADGNSNSAVNCSENEIVAQCLITLLGGFFKTSAITCSTVLELAANPNIQTNLQQEIDRVRDAAENRSITYDMLNGMEYLQKVVLESLRKWTILNRLDRVCTKPYRLSDPANNHSIDINPGDRICIPVCGLHNDERYFPQPKEFDPERFNKERIGFIRPYTYLPFGSGPRNCIATKFSLMQIKAAIVSLLTEFHIEPFRPDARGIKTKNNGVFAEPEGGYKIMLRYRKER